VGEKIANSQHSIRKAVTALDGVFIQEKKARTEKLSDQLLATLKKKKALPGNQRRGDFAGSKC